MNNISNTTEDYYCQRCVGLVCKLGKHSTIHFNVTLQMVFAQVKDKIYNDSKEAPYSISQRILQVFDRNDELF